MPSGIYKRDPKMPPGLVAVCSRRLEAGPMPFAATLDLLDDMALFHDRALRHGCRWLMAVGIHDLYHGAAGPSSPTCGHRDHVKAA